MVAKMVRGSATTPCTLAMVLSQASPYGLTRQLVIVLPGTYRHNLSYHLVFLLIVIASKLINNIVML